MKDECPKCEGNCDCYDVGISLTEDKYTEMLVSAQSQIKELERKLKIAEKALQIYADDKNWTEKIEINGGELSTIVDLIGWRKAAEAIKQIRGE